MLDKKTLKFLKDIRKMKKMPEDVAKEINKECIAPEVSYISQLSRAGFIVLAVPKSGDRYYCLTIDGHAYLEQRTKNALQFWLPWSVTTLLALTSVLVQVLG